MRAFAFAPLLLLAAAAPVDERTFLIGSFERLRVDGPFTVEVSPGSPAAIASGARRALDRVAVRVEGGTLIVSQDPGLVTEDPVEGAVRLRVTVPAMRSVLVNGGAQVRIAEMAGAWVDLALNGGGALTVAGIRGDEVNVTLTGTGAMTLGGTAQRLRMRVFGSGGADASGLVANDAVLISETTGAIRADVRGAARVIAMSSGVVQVLGTPRCTVTGPGPVECAARADGGG